MKVIVIQVDGLQLAALGAYGSVWVETPNLERLAASSVVFDQHFADVPSAEGIVHAMHNGRHCFPPMEGERAVARGQSVFELLIGRKVSCDVSHHGRQSSFLWEADAAKSSPEYLVPSTECSMLGTQHSIPGTEHSELGTQYSVLGTEDLQPHLHRLETIEDILVWFKTHLFPPWDVGEDFFAKQCEDWQLEEVLEPWPNPTSSWFDPNDEITFARLQRTCAAVVESLDEKIGQWLDVLSQQPWWPEAMLVFTAGRGQNLGEHGLVGDFRPWLHEELVHLPLMIRLPHDAEAGRRVFALTQTVDIPATILDFFGVVKPEDWHGSSLLPLCRGGAAIRTFACMGLRIGDASEYALRTADAGIILPHKVSPEDRPRGPMLFIKPDDRWEVNDLRQPNLEEAEKLEQMLREYVAACGFAGEAAGGNSQ